ncbi:hypothetical protein KSP40_PGU002165 [Platanthera guangdongensis]|uniref:Uncharacterized protein n=1 Tax=Platanthera guangdongensis TaxID=2320717 RepID=A0ABR2LPA9_9ASPA
MISDPTSSELPPSNSGIQLFFLVQTLYHLRFQTLFPEHSRNSPQQHKGHLFQQKAEGASSQSPAPMHISRRDVFSSRRIAVGELIHTAK